MSGKIHHRGPLRPEDFENLNMGVILTGYLGKMKKHYNETYQRRFVVLTYKAMHWFEREEGYDLFGKEQNHIQICDIVKCVPWEHEEKKHFDVLSKDGFLRRFVADDEAHAVKWVRAITGVMDSLAHGIVHRLSISEIDNVDLFADPSLLCQVSVVAVTAQATNDDGVPTGAEVVIAKDTQYEEAFPVPHLGQGQVLNVLLSDSSLCTISFEELKEAFKDGGKITKKVVGSSLAAELDISAKELPAAKRSAGVADLIGAITTKLLGSTGDPVYSCKGDRTPGLLTGPPVVAMAVFLLCALVFRLMRSEWQLGVSTTALLLAVYTLVGDELGSSEEVRPWTLAFTSHRLLAPDEAGEQAIPVQFIEGCPPLTEASRRWDITAKWRKQEGIDDMLDEPQPHFNNIKRYYPHFCCGRTRDGDVVYYEQVGNIDLAALRDRGLSIDLLVRHYLFTTEFMWRMTHPTTGGRVLTIFDVEGVAISDLGGDAKAFLAKSMAVVQNHYPERSKKILIINAPGWFSIIWKVIRGWINEETRKKINILTPAETAAGIGELVDADQIPRCYGGELEIGDGSKHATRFYSPQEQDMRAYVNALNAYHGKDETSVPMPPPGLRPGQDPPKGEKEARGQKVILARDLPPELIKGTYDIAGESWDLNGPAGVDVNQLVASAAATPKGDGKAAPVWSRSAGSMGNIRENKSTGNLARRSHNDVDQMMEAQAALSRSANTSPGNLARRSHNDVDQMMKAQAARSRSANTSPVPIEDEHSMDLDHDRVRASLDRRVSLLDDASMEHAVYRRPPRQSNR